LAQEFLGSGKVFRSGVAMAIAHAEFTKMQEGAVLLIDDGLPSLLLDEKQECSFGTPRTPMCTPRELLRRTSEETSKPEIIEFETTSDASTADTDNRVLEIDTPNQGLPSVGSASHSLGLCTPCGFLYKGGCSEGVDCKYCHVCPPGTIELARKMKRRHAKLTRHAQHSFRGA